jgi:hypothetical protein
VSICQRTLSLSTATFGVDRGKPLHHGCAGAGPDRAPGRGSPPPLNGPFFNNYAQSFCFIFISKNKRKTNAIDSLMMMMLNHGS